MADDSMESVFFG